MPETDRDSDPAVPPRRLLSTVPSALPDGEHDLAELLFALGSDAVPPLPAVTIPDPAPVTATATKPSRPSAPPPAAPSPNPRRSAWKRSV